MYPELFSVGPVTIYSYGFMITTGAIICFIFMKTQAKRKLHVETDKIQMLVITCIVSAFVGGKVFFILEKPSFYFSNPLEMIRDFKNGFVFYGSLLFTVPSVLWFFHRQKIPIRPMMDLMAFAAIILHGFGRMGCFLAGCCFGKETDGPIFVSYTNPAAVAPTDVHLHPTQLYSIALLITIGAIMWMFKRHQRFEGQLFFLYIMLYAFGRGVIEIFRGDVKRGFIIEDWVSHSQLISFIIIAIAGILYMRNLKMAARSSPELLTPKE